MTELNFDANTVDPISSFDPLPVGDYLVVITSSELKDTKQKTGKYLQLTYDVVDGEYKNRKIFDRLNIMNPSEDAQSIAQRALSSICRAVGVMHPKQSEELHDKPFVVKLGIRPAAGEYQASNVVKGYKNKDGSTIGENKSNGSSSETQSKGKRPWEH
jgi:hypothetical protein